MPISSSGAISLGRSASTTRENSAGHRLGYVSDSIISMNNADVRGLAEVSTTSGTTWSMSSLRGKPSWAYTATYDCSSYTGWTKYADTSGSDSSHKTTLYPLTGSYHWRFFSDGNEISYAYQTRSFDIANSFDLQFDVRTDTAYEPLQIGIATNSSLGGAGFSYWYNGLFTTTLNNVNMAPAATAEKWTGTLGSRIIVLYQANCDGTTTGAPRQALWTRLRFVGTRSGTTWSGTVTAISLEAADYGTVLGSSPFSFTSSGNYLVLRSYSDDDNGETGNGQSRWVDNIWVTLD